MTGLKNIRLKVDIVIEVGIENEIRQWRCQTDRISISIFLSKNLKSKSVNGDAP